MPAGLYINVSVSRLILAKTLSLLISMGRHLLRLSYLGSILDWIVPEGKREREKVRRGRKQWTKVKNLRKQTDRGL